jgi:hypothetical protein
MDLLRPDAYKTPQANNNQPAMAFKITSIQIRPWLMNRENQQPEKGLFTISVSPGCNVMVKAPAIAKRLFAPNSSRKDKS